MTIPNSCVVLLAAGLSQRMGDINKLLIPVGNKPMIRHVAEQYIEAGIDNIIVVVGHQQERIRNALAGLNLTIVFNENFRDGQITSIRCGFKMLPAQVKTVLVGLSDQPLLSANDIKQMVNTFLQQSEKSMLVPYYQGIRGNPILLSAEQALAVDSDGIRLGCRKLIDRYPEKVLRFEATNHHYTCDLDTAIEVKNLLGDEAMVETL